MDSELDQLEVQAAAVDADAAAPDPSAPPEPEAVAIDAAAEVAALLQTVAGILTPAFPCLAEIYNEATCQRLGEAAAPVMDKYEVSVGGLFERWGAEITLAAVALPVGIATVQGIKADLAARKAKPEKQAESSEGQGAYAEERAGPGAGALVIGQL